MCILPFRKWRVFWVSSRQFSRGKSLSLVCPNDFLFSEAAERNVTEMYGNPDCHNHNRKMWENIILRPIHLLVVCFLHHLSIFVSLHLFQNTFFSWVALEDSTNHQLGIRLFEGSVGKLSKQPCVCWMWQKHNPQLQRFGYLYFLNSLNKTNAF